MLTIGGTALVKVLTQWSMPNLSTNLTKNALLIEYFRMKQYYINFNGYRRDCNKATLPKYSGVYMVYRCVCDSATEKVTLKEIIYIGQAEDLNERLNNHERNSDFLKACVNGEEICYAYANISMDDLDIIENALIFSQKPSLNTELVDSFNHESASFLIEGKCSLLRYTNFTIE